MSSTGCVCDQTQPPPRLTKLTQTWKTERSILTPLPAPCPRPPLPLLVAALQGVVETMKGKWKSDSKISLNMFGCQMREGRRRWFYQPPTPHACIVWVLEERRTSRLRMWNCRHFTLKSWNIRGMRWRHQSEHRPAVGPSIAPSLRTLRKTTTSSKSVSHETARLWRVHLEQVEKRSSNSKSLD